MIENRDRQSLVADLPGEHRPAPAGAPHRVALLAFAARVFPGHAGVVHDGHLRGPSRDVRVHLRLGRRLLELTRDAHPEHAVFCVREDDALVERRQRRHALDAPRRSVAGKCKLGPLMQDRLARWKYPVHLCDQLAAIGAALRRNDPAMKDRSHLRGIVRLECVGVPHALQLRGG